jgi:hypothetical protein
MTPPVPPRRALVLVLVFVLASAAGCSNSADSADAQREAAAAQAAAEAPPPPSAPRRVPPFSLTDREAWRRMLSWPATCEHAFQSTRATEDGGLLVAELAPGLSIVAVTCAAGSYQPSHAFIRLDERGSSPVATTLEFQTYESADGVTLNMTAATELFGHATLSPDRRELSILSLSRQLADCGIWSRYAVATERPQLIAAVAQLPCPFTPGPPAESPGGDAPSGWRPIRLTK